MLKFHIKLILVIGVMCFTTYLIVILLMVFSPDINNFLNREQFDSEKWISWEESEKDWQLRWNMVKSLEKEFHLTGMSENEVIKLLGEPTSEGSNWISYNLGPTGRGINYGILRLDFQNKIVTNYIVYQH